MSSRATSIPAHKTAAVGATRRVAHAPVGAKHRVRVRALCPRWSVRLVRCSSVLLLAAAAAGCGLHHARLHPGPAAPGDWPTLGGGARNKGVAGAHSIPVSVDGLLWRRKTGAVASSEPVVRGGLLYFPGLDGRLGIYDSRSGDRLARVSFKGPVTGVIFGDSGFTVATDQNERRLIFMTYNPLDRRHSIAIPTSGVSPRRIDDGSLIVAALNGEVSKYDSLGGLLWKIDVKGPVTAAPVVADSVVLIAAGHSVSARRASDGGQIWSHQASGAVLAAPAVDDRAYFGSTDSLLYAVNTATGTMGWFFAARGQITVSPVTGSDHVYLASNDYRVYSLDKATGDTVWSYDTGGPVTTRPTLAGDMLYVGTQTGELLILNAATGALVRSFKLDGLAATPPIIADGRVYIADTKRRLYCFGNSSVPTPGSAPDATPR